MIVRHSSFVATVAFSFLACTDAGQKASTDSTQPVPEASQATTQSRKVQAWWEMGDSFGPLKADLEGDQVVRIDQDLSHGDYGTKRASFEFENDNLVRYSQKARLRLIDPENPSDLVSVHMDLEFDTAGNLVASTKTAGGVPVDLDPLDEDRIRGQSQLLVEKVLEFDRVYETGGEPVRYLCNGDESFQVVYSEQAAILDLGPFDGRYVLPHQPSGSGAKFSNDWLVLWTKGNEAFVERHSERFLGDCTTEE